MFYAFLATRKLAHAVTRRIEIFFQFRKKKVKARNLTEKQFFFFQDRRSTIRGRKIDFENSRPEKNGFSIGIPTESSEANAFRLFFL